MKQLTKEEREAVLSIIVERLSGGVEDLQDAFGIEFSEAEKMIKSLEGARNKLQGL